MAREPKSTLDDVVDNSGVMPEQTATVVDNSGVMPEQTATVVDNSGVMPEQTATVVDNSGVMPEQTATTVEAPAKPFDQNAHSMEISRIIREARANENSSALRGEVNRLKSQIRRMQSEGVR